MLQANKRELDLSNLRDKGWISVRLGENLIAVWHPPFPHPRAYFDHEVAAIQDEYEAGLLLGDMRCAYCLLAQEKVARSRDEAFRQSVGRILITSVVVVSAICGAVLMTLWLLQ